MKIIDINNVDFSYISNDNKKIKALDNISIQIESGSFVAILGHNGSGKSTLARLMNGLVIADKGEVLLDSKNPKNEEDLFSIRQNIGMIFQNPDNQIVASIVEEDVAFGPENLGIPACQIKKRVDEALKIVNLEKYKKNSTAFLSGGQKQRLSIASVLAMKPKCIILDESTAMLDPVGRRDILETISNLNKIDNITIILITHYMEEAIQADKIYVMSKGSIVLDGSPREIFKNFDLLRELHLDVPQITEIAHRLQPYIPDLEKNILSTNEMVEVLCKYRSKT